MSQDQESKIPLEEATAFFSEVKKIAVSDLWVHKAVQAAGKSAPAERLLETARKGLKGAISASGKGNEAAARKYMTMRHSATGAALDSAMKNRVLKKVAELAVAEEEGAAVDPTEELALWLARMLGHEFKLHQWYTYYAEMVRGAGRGDLAETFEEIAADELKDASYLSRRLAGMGATVQIPPTPAPAPESDPVALVNLMLAEEERGIAILYHLHQLCPETEPMRFELEAMLADEQVHKDRLTQHLPVAGKTKKAAEAPVPAQQPSAQDIAVSQLSGDLAQLTNENAALKNELNQAAGMLEQHAEAAQQAEIAAQQMNEQLMAAQDQAMASQQQASDAMVQAQQGQADAAAQADMKARIAIRVQQIRQQLADLVSQDPVAEEGADADPIATATQQGLPPEEEEEAALAEQPAQEKPKAELSKKKEAAVVLHLAAKKLKDMAGAPFRAAGKNLATGALKSDEGKKVKALLGASAGTGLLATGTAVHEGRKTRRLIEEHEHGKYAGLVLDELPEVLGTDLTNAAVDRMFNLKIAEDMSSDGEGLSGWPEAAQGKEKKPAARKDK